MKRLHDQIENNCPQTPKSPKSSKKVKHKRYFDMIANDLLTIIFDFLVGFSMKLPRPTDWYIPVPDIDWYTLSLVKKSWNMRQWVSCLSTSVKPTNFPNLFTWIKLSDLTLTLQPQSAMSSNMPNSSNSSTINSTTNSTIARSAMSHTTLLPHYLHQLEICTNTLWDFKWTMAPTNSLTFLHLCSNLMTTSLNITDVVTQCTFPNLQTAVFECCQFTAPEMNVNTFAPQLDELQMISFIQPVFTIQDKNNTLRSVMIDKCEGVCFHWSTNIEDLTYLFPSRMNECSHMLKTIVRLNKLRQLRLKIYYVTDFARFLHSMRKSQFFQKDKTEETKPPWPLLEELAVACAICDYSTGDILLTPHADTLTKLKLNFLRWPVELHLPHFASLTELCLKCPSSTLTSISHSLTSQKLTILSVRAPFVEPPEAAISLMWLSKHPLTYLRLVNVYVWELPKFPLVRRLHVEWEGVRGREYNLKFDKQYLALTSRGIEIEMLIDNPTVWDLWAQALTPCSTPCSTPNSTNSATPAPDSLNSLTLDS